MYVYVTSDIQEVRSSCCYNIFIKSVSVPIKYVRLINYIFKNMCILRIIIKYPLSLNIKGINGSKSMISLT